MTNTRQLAHSKTQSHPLVYVCVMSNYSLPNLEAIVTRKPSEVVLVVTDFQPAKDAAERLADVLQHRLPALTLHRPDQQPGAQACLGDNPVEAQRWVDSVLAPFLKRFQGKPCWLNMTGGTKALSLALLARLRWTGIDYKADGKNALLHFTLTPDDKALAHLDDTKDHDPLTPLREVDATDVARLYNPSVKTSTSKAAKLPEPKRNALAEDLFSHLQMQDPSLAGIFSLLNHVWCEQREQPAFNASWVTLPLAKVAPQQQCSLDTVAIDAWLKRFNALANAFSLEGQTLTLPGNDKLPADIKALKHWLTGEWLEQLVYHWVRQAGVPAQGVALNVHGGQDERNSSTQREADLLIQHKSHTYLIEVKAAIPPDSDLRAIQTQLASLQNHFGRAQLVLFVGPQFRQQLSEEKWQAFVHRVMASQGHVCTTRDELLAVLKLASNALPPPKADTRPSRVSQPSKTRVPSVSPVMENTLKALCHLAFLRSAWGEDNPEHQRDIEQARQEVQALGHPEGITRFEKALRQGRHGHDLWEQLKRKLETQGDGDDVTRWLEKTQQHSAAAAFRHVTLALKRWRQHQQDRRHKVQQRKGANRYHSALTPTVLQHDGQHPKSVSALSPAPRWEILIDETGTAFDSTVEQAAPDSATLGRVVAIIKAHTAKLPALSPHFHGVKETPETLDRAFEQLLKTPQVGVFGFTVKDRIAFGSYWMNHIAQLVRWTLYLLPVNDGDPTRVDISIEQRSSYQVGDERLKALSQTLEGEFRALDPARFAKLSLRMRIVAKEHPHLAYADAVAYTWGSPAAVNDDRLKKSRLLGHCLMHPHHEQSLQHLYLALSYHDHLPPEQWYALCSAVEKEGEHSLLARWMEKLGARLTTQPEQWQRYLAEVQHQMRLKGGSLMALASSLAWLERFQPHDRELSGELQLHFVSARLALANHQGRVDIAALQDLFALSRVLEDENAPAVCQALMRAAITTTNHFEFSAMEAIISEWIKKPIAIPGRLNHAKLLSTQGQLAAFQQRPSEADALFSQALMALERLSDPQQAKRERTQTRTYQLMARLDDPTHPAMQQRADLETLLTEATGRKALAGVARRFAVGGGGSEVYLHHLLLRACLALPQALDDITQCYLEQQKSWQWHDGHPWGLIHAYRGWLLARQGHHDQASACFKAALKTCWAPESGVTLHWMGAVIFALAQSLLAEFSIDVPEYAHPCKLQKALPHASYVSLNAFETLPNQMTHAHRWSLLTQCLPFNFH